MFLPLANHCLSRFFTVFFGVVCLLAAAGANAEPFSYVSSVVTLQNGQVLVAGSIDPDGDDADGEAASWLIRLNADGTSDDTFNAVPLDPDRDYSLQAQADGKILLNSAGDDENSEVLRYNANGSRDVSFPAGTVELADTVGDGDIHPPPGPGGGVIIKRRPAVTIFAVPSKVYAGSTIPGKFILRRTASDYSQPLRVVYRLEGSAVMGEDYRFVNRVRIIGAGRQTAHVTIRPLGRRFRRIEGGRAHVTATLLRRGPYRLGKVRAAKIKLIDPGSLPNHHS